MLQVRRYLKLKDLEDLELNICMEGREERAEAIAKRIREKKRLASQESTSLTFEPGTDTTAIATATTIAPLGAFSGTTGSKFYSY